jgi:hypothetical protein
MRATVGGASVVGDGRFTVRAGTEKCVLDARARRDAL